jgi:hypothetical protein
MVKLDEENVLLQITIPRMQYHIYVDRTAALYLGGFKLKFKYED